MSFTVKNTGSRAGAEVAQLYVRRKTPGMLRPALSLAGFARVELLPGEEKTVFLPLGERSFAVWSCAKNRWVVEEGEYELCVGRVLPRSAACTHGACCRRSALR